VIVTGQQPAVGGGPLYTLVKVAHATALARQRAVPALFWCASEDHDLGEAGHADFIERNGTIRRCSVDLNQVGSNGQAHGRASLRFRPAAVWWDTLWTFSHQHLGPGLGADFLRAHAPVRDEGMGMWLCRLLKALFPGLEAIEGHTLRPRWETALMRAFDQWPTAELAKLRAKLLATGADDAFGELVEAPIFADEANGRVALTINEARQRLANGDLAVLSPGAALRPILQQAALPCTAYVGGPGELAYHRFIMPLYTALRVEQPELIARCSLTVVPSWCARACAALGGSPEQPARIVDPVQSDETGTLAAFDDVLQRLRSTSALSGSLHRLEAERAHLARRLSRFSRPSDLPSAGSLRAYLSPRGGRQERTMSLFQALWEHGPGLAPRLVEAAANCAPGEHRTVIL